MKSIIAALVLALGYALSFAQAPNYERECPGPANNGWSVNREKFDCVKRHTDAAQQAQEAAAAAKAKAAAAKAGTTTVVYKSWSCTVQAKHVTCQGELQ